MKLKVSYILLAAITVAGCSSAQKQNSKPADGPVAVEATPVPVTNAAPEPMTPAEEKQAEVVLPKTIQASVNSAYRNVEFTKRDKYRHPVETLKFFGLQPNMTVVEITPGAGWYTEILAPFLAANGKYVGAFPPAGENAEMNETTAKVIAWLKKHDEFKGHTTVVDFKPSESMQLAPDGTADMVLTFRNVHNWMKAGNVEKVFASFNRALKPGGILGIEEHRANPKAKRDETASSGYVLEKDVIEIAKRAGFRLASKSEINANKKDTKDYPQGVWTLPPTLRLKEQDREKYLAIGESDRMTLKFIKNRN